MDFFAAVGVRRFDGHLAPGFQAPFWMPGPKRGAGVAAPFGSRCLCARLWTSRALTAIIGAKSDRRGPRQYESSGIFGMPSVVKWATLALNRGRRSSRPSSPPLRSSRLFNCREQEHHWSAQLIDPIGIFSQGVLSRNWLDQSLYSEAAVEDICHVGR